MTDKVQKIREEVEMVVSRRLNLLNGDYFDLNKEVNGFTNEIMNIIDSLQEEPVSEDLEEAAKEHSFIDVSENVNEYKHLWKPADGEDLPEIDREVVAFQEIFPTDVDAPSLFKIVMAHRPNPKGYDGKSIATGKVEHYTPKTYDKGGWNIPNIVYWLDVELPKEIEP